MHHTSHSAVLRRRLVVLTAAAALAFGACSDDGGDDDADPTTVTEDTGGGNDSGDAAFDADALTECLTDAGFDPEANDIQAFGVDDPFERIDVALAPEGTDSELTAEIYVFESAEAAEFNRPAITLQNEDSERNRVIENVLLTYTIIPSFDQEGADAVESCLEP